MPEKGYVLTGSQDFHVFKEPTTITFPLDPILPGTLKVFEDEETHFILPATRAWRVVHLENLGVE